MPVPAHHVRWAIGLNTSAALGLVPLVWGLWAFSLPWVLLGLAVSMGAKTWFVDRMGFLYDEMRDAEPGYAAWSLPAEPPRAGV